MSEKPFIDQMIENLSHESQFLREEAAFELSFVNSESAIEALLKGLSDPMPKIRAACAKSLSKYGSMYSGTVAPRLVEKLSDADAEVAKNAAKTLGVIGDKSCVPSLIEFMKSANKTSKIYAIMAIGRIGDETILPALLKMLRDETDDKVRATVLIAIGHFANPKLFPVIVKYGFEDADPRVRASAVEAVVGLNMPAEAVAEPLKKMLNDDNNRVVANACLGLWKAGDLSVVDHIYKLVKSRDKWFRASGAYVLGKIGNTESMNMLLSLKTDPEADVRLNVARSLANYHTSKAVTALIEMLDDSDEIVKKSAYNSIIKCNDKSMFWQMAQNLKSEHETIRYIAVRVLFNIDDPAAIPLIAEVVEKETNAEVRNELNKFLTILRDRHQGDSKKPQAAHANKTMIIQRGVEKSQPIEGETNEGSSVVTAIIEKMSHKSQFIREEAAFELSHINSLKAITALLNGLSDQVPKIRAICAKSISRYGRHFQELVIPKLIDLLYDENSEVAQNAAQSLGFVGDKSCVKSLIELLENPNQNTRLYAALALGKLGDDVATRPLLEAMKNEKEQKVRATFLIALGNIANPKIFPIIQKFGFPDPDPRVRASAVEAVSKLNLPLDTILEPLTKMLADPNNRVVANACMALWNAGELSAVTHVIRLIKSTDKWSRASGAYVLGKIGNNDAVNMLISMKNDHDADVRLNVARSLKDIKTSKGLTILIEMLDDSDEMVKRVAYDTILECNDKYAFWPMVQYLKSIHETIRYIATRVLCNIDDPKAASFIFEAISKERNPEVKNEMVKYALFLTQRHPRDSFKDIFGETNNNVAVQNEAFEIVSNLTIEANLKETLLESARTSKFAKIKNAAEKKLAEMHKPSE